MTVPEEDATTGAEALPLAADFPAADREQWQRLVSGVLAKSGKTDLAGPGAEQALATEVEDGLRVQPLYTAEDSPGDAGWPGFAPFTRGGRAQGSATDGWDVRQQHARPDVSATNEAVLADLDNGVSSVWLTLSGSESGAAGLPVSALPDVLKGVYLDLAGVVLDAGADFAAAADALLTLYGAVPASSVTGNLGADPLGVLARTGSDGITAAGLARLQADAGRLAARCAAEFPDVRALTVDALPYHEAGGSAAAELGLSMATAVAYLRTLTDAGLTVDDAAGQLEFRYAATADQFLTIAKLRAARRLWARVAEVCGVGTADASGTASGRQPAAQLQHAVTSTVMMTERDPWVNMLRTTVACLGAGAGGADAITVLPFDTALGLPDDFARRIARNTQAILLEETNLARVIDPAGGSWYVENLTSQLADNAWAYFQEIERAGGIEAALRSGLVASRLAENWAARSKNLAKRREAITGVSEFPNLAEQPVVRDPAPARPDGGLPRVRRSEVFEALRDLSDAALESSGARPSVALATLGSAAVYTARSTFAANLFGAGGIETPLLSADLDVAALAEAFKASGAPVACLCSSDKLYAEHAEAAARALKAAGARRVVLAGRPGDRRSDYEKAGVDDFVYAGSDAVAALTSVFTATEASTEGEAR